MAEKNGYDFIRSLRKNEKDHIPALALTAFTSTQSEKKALDAGFEMYMQKPIESTKLVSALKYLISG